jgi:hypothetical protein
MIRSRFVLRLVRSLMDRVVNELARQVNESNLNLVRLGWLDLFGLLNY